MSDLDTYLDLLFGGLEGYVYAPVKTSTNWEQKFFEWPGEATQLQDWIKISDREATSHVYISPALYSRRDAHKSAIKSIQTAWIEFDGQDRVDFKGVPVPTAIVQSSSSTHLHCYWRIPPSSKEVVEDVNRRLTYYLGSDSSGWDCTQLLRPPTTTNKKRETPLPVSLVSFDNSQYNLPDFDSAPGVVAPALETIEPGVLIDWLTVLKGRNLPTRILMMVKKETPPVGARSSFIAKLAFELAEEGFNHLEIVSVLYHVDSRVKKFEGRDDQLLRLTQIAELALHKIVAADSLTLYSLEDLLYRTEDIKWIMEPWIPQGGLMLLSSAPNVGKTQLGLQLTVSLALGENFLGMKCNDSLKHFIFFMSLEMEPSGLKYVLKAQKEAWSSIPTNYQVTAGEEGTLTQYENQIEKLQPTLVFIDSLSEILDLVDEETDNAKAKFVMRWIRKIRRRYGCAIVIIHHNRKATEGNKKPKGLADLAGSFEFGRVSDTVIQLWEDSTGIEVSSVKCRYGPKEAFLTKRDPERLWFSRNGDSSNSQGRRTEESSVHDESTIRSSIPSRTDESEPNSLEIDLDVSDGPKPIQSNPPRDGIIPLDFG